MIHPQPSGSRIAEVETGGDSVLIVLFFSVSFLVQPTVAKLLFWMLLLGGAFLTTCIVDIQYWDSFASDVF